MTRDAKEGIDPRGSQQSGFSFPFAMGALAILLILGGSLLTLVVNETNMLVRHYDQRRAYYLAEAAINHALFELNSSPVGDGVTSGTMQVGGNTGTYSTTYSQGILTATGSLPAAGVSKRIEVQVEEEHEGADFSQTAAILTGEINTVPAKATLWNYLGVSESSRVTVINTKSNTLNINGYVLNNGQPYEGSEALGWAYSAGNVGPASKVDVNFRVAASAPSYLFPIVDTTTYDNLITAAGSPSNGSLTGNVSLGAGTYAYSDLTISGATLTANSTATRVAPVYIIVTGDLTITSSTIGVANPTTLAKPSDPPSSDNPYGNWIRILVKDEATISGAIDSRASLHKEVRIYAEDEIKLRDYVTVGQAGLFASDKISLETGETGTASTWQTQTSGTSRDLHGVDFHDQTNGIAVGDQGTVQHTSDAGATWNATQTSISADLAAVTFSSASDAWLAGDGGEIWHSANGGTNWTQQASGGSDLYGVSFADASKGAAVGDNGTIRYTANGGSSWQNASVPSGSPDLKDVAMLLDGSTYMGWAVGEDYGKPSRAAIWKTTDGGQNWASLSSPTNRDLTGVTFIDDENGWVVGEHNVLYRTTDGGQSWSSQDPGNYNGDFAGVDAWGDYQVLAVGESKNSTASLHTTNGGYIWDGQTMPTSSNRDLNGAVFVDQRNGWTVGDQGTILKQTGPTIDVNGTMLAKEELRAKSNPAGAEIWVEGAAVAGYRYPDPASPGSYITDIGTVQLSVQGQGSHLEDILFNVATMPESDSDGIGVPVSATLVYTSWRET